MKMFSLKNTTASRPPDCRFPRVLDPATIRVGARRCPIGADRHKIGSAPLRRMCQLIYVCVHVAFNILLCFFCISF